MLWFVTRVQKKLNPKALNNSFQSSVCTIALAHINFPSFDPPYICKYFGVDKYTYMNQLARLNSGITVYGIQSHLVYYYNYIIGRRLTSRPNSFLNHIN